jgi:hypothetical protein
MSVLSLQVHCLVFLLNFTSISKCTQYILLTSVNTHTHTHRSPLPRTYLIKTPPNVLTNPIYACQLTQTSGYSDNKKMQGRSVRRCLLQSQIVRYLPSAICRSASVAWVMLPSALLLLATILCFKCGGLLPNPLKF